MKFQKAIEEAKRVAQLDNTNCIVFQWKEHWWKSYKYDCCSYDTFYAIRRTTPVIKLLVITPDGTIAQ